MHVKTVNTKELNLRVRGDWFVSEIWSKAFYQFGRLMDWGDPNLTFSALDQLEKCENWQALRWEWRGGKQAKEHLTGFPRLAEREVRFDQGECLHCPNVEDFAQTDHPIQRLKTLLEGAVGCAVSGISLFIAPSNCAGIGYHHDDDDVFALQLDGTKNWALFERIAPQLYENEKTAKQGDNPCLSRFTLRPMELLYIPRGMPHEVTTSNCPSVSLAFAFRHQDWADHLSRVVAVLLREHSAKFFETDSFLPGGPTSDIPALLQLAHEVLNQSTPEDWQRIMAEHPVLFASTQPLSGRRRY